MKRYRVIQYYSGSRGCIVYSPEEYVKTLFGKYKWKPVRIYYRQMRIPLTFTDIADAKEWLRFMKEGRNLTEIEL